MNLRINNRNTIDEVENNKRSKDSKLKSINVI